MTREDDHPGDIPYTDLWGRPGFLIRRLHQLHVAVFLEECGDFDVTPVQYAVLSVLYRGKALDQVSVAAEVGIDRNNAADVLRRLERRGFGRWSCERAAPLTSTGGASNAATRPPQAREHQRAPESTSRESTREQRAAAHCQQQRRDKRDKSGSCRHGDLSTRSSKVEQS